MAIPKRTCQEISFLLETYVSLQAAILQLHNHRQQSGVIQSVSWRVPVSDRMGKNHVDKDVRIKHDSQTNTPLLPVESPSCNPAFLPRF